MNDLLIRAAAVRLLVLDVDGVLTDGRLYFSARGDEVKAFHVRDGAGIVLLRRAGVEIGVITGRSSPAVERRMTELGVTRVRQGVQDKLPVLREWLTELKLEADAIACIGDDIAEAPLLKIARLSVAVADAHPTAREHAHFVTQAPGGMGAVREVCDLILQAKGA